MQHLLKQEFKDIAKEIVSENKTDVEWAQIESDDMFQKAGYVGGYDATEKEFVFGILEEGRKRAFQLSLEEMKGVAENRITSVELHQID